MAETPFPDDRGAWGVGHGIAGGRHLDPARLAALARYGILDTPPEKGFDDIVHLARRLCGTQVALVSLVGADRQWFKARSGFDGTETPIASSVCVHALASEDILVIPDMTKDDRTAANPLVVGGPQIRFYAGAPLVTSDGHILGSLCVIDTAPRADGLTVEQADDLRRLADQVVSLMEMRRAIAHRDVLVQEKSEAEERASDERRRLSLMFDQAPSFMAMLRGPEHRFEYANPAYRRVVGGRDVVGRTVADVMPDAAAQGYVDILDRVYASGEPYTAEGALYSIRIGPDAPVVDRYVDFVFQPVRDASGAVAGIFIDGSDVTERLRQMRRQAVLAELGESLRGLDDIGDIVRTATQSLVGAIDYDRIGFGTVDADNETVNLFPETLKDGLVSVSGSHSFRTFGSYIENLKRGETVAIPDVVMDDRTSASAEEFAKLDIGALLNLPVIRNGRLVLVVFVHRSEPYRWADDDLWFVRQVGDRTQAAIAQIEAEAQQNVLNQELSHRLKNTLAMVQAICKQTLKDVENREAVDALTRRIHALSAAHEVLLRKSWSSARIREVASAVLATFDRPDAIELSGADLTLGARAALCFSLVVHELGTNALKYGALSVPEGRVRIGWRIEGDGEDAELVFRWSEHGGPPAVEPSSRRGFGSRLIRMGLTGTGGVETSYGNEGLSVVMRASLIQIRQS
ncbi:MAG: GAF domain-containing protein [Fulvimarina manganoxydans]|uniref:GAF domain-containing protein n=1 Tax=Fulvimarina manganoxydans TaxID=937218 RepID=UPI0023541883|nr:GAF domain-containing protein [Fulvimarina manganoxydans]MCK5931014.1 GAF domain-containing protein [Fulvimarina manganoxydans]